MKSPLKCAQCGKKPTVKANAQRGAWNSAGIGKSMPDKVDTQARMNASGSLHESRGDVGLTDIIRSDGAGESDRASQEHVAKMSPTKASMEASRIAEIFRSADHDETGYIERGELREVLALLSSAGGRGTTMDDEQLDRTLELIDVNGDGVIDYDEFASWLTHEGDATHITDRMRYKPAGTTVAPASPTVTRAAQDRSNKTHEEVMRARHQIEVIGGQSGPAHGGQWFTDDNPHADSGPTFNRGHHDSTAGAAAAGVHARPAHGSKAGPKTHSKHGVHPDQQNRVKMECPTCGYKSFPQWMNDEAHCLKCQTVLKRRRGCH